MSPSENAPEYLTCMRDGVPVSAQDPRCQHPTSYCPFRFACLVIDAQSDRRREAEQDRS